MPRRYRRDYGTIQKDEKADRRSVLCPLRAICPPHRARPSTGERTTSMQADSTIVDRTKTSVRWSSATPLRREVVLQAQRRLSARRNSCPVKLSKVPDSGARAQLPRQRLSSKTNTTVRWQTITTDARSRA